MGKSAFPQLVAPYDLEAKVCLGHCGPLSQWVLGPSVSGWYPCRFLALQALGRDVWVCWDFFCFLPLSSRLASGPPGS